MKLFSRMLALGSSVLVFAVIAADFTTLTTFNADVTVTAWTNTPVIRTATNTIGGAAAVTGAFSYAVQPTNASGMGVSSLPSNATFRATGNLIRITWTPAAGAQGYLVWRNGTNWISLGATTQFVDYGTNAWSNGLATTSAVVPVVTAPKFGGNVEFSGAVTMTNGRVQLGTNTMIGTNLVATLADISAGTVTNNQWHGDTDRIGLVASNALTSASARLSSNVWALAASTTNYLPKTGGTFIADSTEHWFFMDDPGIDGFGTTGPSGDFAVIVDGSVLAVVSSAGLTLNSGSYFGDGSHLTGISAGSVSLTTNRLLVLDSTPGDWACARLTSGPTTNNSVTPPVGDGYATVDGRTFPISRMESQMTNTWHTRTVVSRMVEQGEVATNIAQVKVVFPGASATATNILNFLGPTSNTIATLSVTTAGIYDVTASLIASNRRWHILSHIYCPPAVGTNVAWVAMPRVEVIKQ